MGDWQTCPCSLRFSCPFYFHYSLSSTVASLKETEDVLEKKDCSIILWVCCILRGRRNLEFILKVQSAPHILSHHFFFWLARRRNFNKAVSIDVAVFLWNRQQTFDKSPCTGKRAEKLFPFVGQISIDMTLISRDHKTSEVTPKSGHTKVLKYKLIYIIIKNYF